MIAIFYLLCYLFAWWAYKQSRFTASITIIVIFGVLINTWACSDPWLHAWDERYHALVGRNLSQHFLKPTLYDNPLLPYNYQSWTNNYIWLHKQPVALWLIAISVKTFGFTAFAVRIPSIIFSALGVILIYDIGAKWFSKRIGLLSAFLFSINGLIIDLVSGNNNTDHIDVCFLVFVLLCIWLIIQAHKYRKYYLHIVAGFVLGIAILTKWLPALIVLPIWLLLAYEYRKGNTGKLAFQLLLFSLAACCVAIPWQLFIFKTYPLEANWEYYYNSVHLTNPVEGHSGPWYYHLDNLRIFFGETVYIPVLWFIYRTIKNPTVEYKIILVWFLIPYLFFSCTATKMPAYILIAAPAIFLMIALFFDACLDWIKQRSKYRYFIIVLAFSLIALPVRYCVERLKPFDKKEENRKNYEALINVKKRITNPEKTIVYNCPHYIELMFYTGCVAYENTPDQQTLLNLRERGYVLIKY